MSAWSAPTSTSDLTPGDGVIQPQHHNGADGRDDHAPDVEAGDAAGAERGEQEAADHRADNAEHDVHQQALAGAHVNLAGNEARDKTQDNPGNDPHEGPLLAALV